MFDFCDYKQLGFLHGSTVLVWVTAVWIEGSNTVDLILRVGNLVLASAV